MRHVLGILVVLVGITYPLCVYFGLKWGNPRQVAVLLAVLWIPATAIRHKKNGTNIDGTVIILLVGVLLLLGGAAIANDHRWVFALPVAINAWFALTFGISLRSTPMIERFARLQEKALSDEKQRYCRRVTYIWLAFFIVNGSIAAALAIYSSLELWTLYNGFIAYVLIGTLGASEFVFRRYKFRDFSDLPHDKLLQRILPNVNGRR